jgi:hypothetical protein
MKKTFILIIALSVFVFLFTPNVFPDNFQIESIVNNIAESDVVIIFNSGGWGNTSLEEAEDLLQSLKELKAP